jgi:hypothetical protein
VRGGFRRNCCAYSMPSNQYVFLASDGEDANNRSQNELVNTGWNKHRQHQNTSRGLIGTQSSPRLGISFKALGVWRIASAVPELESISHKYWRGLRPSKSEAMRGRCQKVGSDSNLGTHMRSFDRRNFQNFELI